PVVGCRCFFSHRRHMYSAQTWRYLGARRLKLLRQLSADSSALRAGTTAYRLFFAQGLSTFAGRPAGSKLSRRVTAHGCGGLGHCCHVLIVGGVAGTGSARSVWFAYLCGAAGSIAALPGPGSSLSS